MGGSKTTSLYRYFYHTVRGKHTERYRSLVVLLIIKVSFLFDYYSSGFFMNFWYISHNVNYILIFWESITFEWKCLKCIFKLIYTWMCVTYSELILKYSNVLNGERERESGDFHSVECVNYHVSLTFSLKNILIRRGSRFKHSNE